MNGEKTKKTRVSVQLLWEKTTLLLDMSLRISNLQHMYGRKFVGVYVQWNQLAVPGLRGFEAVLDSKINSIFLM
ncbi:MAG: hypothetical protein SV375_17885 [Thermodesulfobacteriota bacterium]|nr:hypothetical protein [Thermodesulfobacteriota bacterium]